MATHSAQGPLFLARCARVQGAQFPAIASGSVYHCVSQALTTLRELKNIASESYVASWAAVIRNTVIRRWIDELVHISAHRGRRFRLNVDAISA